MVRDEAGLAERSINTIRFLAVDAIGKAKSGHPGLPMGAAAMAYTLWTRHLSHNPANPRWFNRDRFVLSAGHGSMLLYALLHLTGYDLSLDDIRNFRQWQSRTPGHPEYGHTPGVEVTTGPLGQGVANAVGMAVAEAYLAARYNRPGFEIINHSTYVIAGDGDLIEGVAMEACSLAGHLRLGKLIVLYDDNGISLAGSTALTFTEDVTRRFEASGWYVERVGDGNDVEAIDAAIARARAETGRPSLIRVETVIGYGSPCKQGSCSCHGSPLTMEEAEEAKQHLGWPVDEKFFIPAGVREHMREALARGGAREKECGARYRDYRARYPECAAELDRLIEGTLPDGWESAIPDFPSGGKPLSTRKASETVLQALGKILPELVGGTADLNPSTLARLKGQGDFQSPAFNCGDVQGAVGGVWDYSGRNIHFGVREHAMGAIANGMALHGGLVPFTGTFFVFSDYMRPAIRLAALMGLRIVYVFSHDSIAVGEDGPTHQPVEQLMSLRVIPNITVVRPADAAETAEAWKYALENHAGPTAIVLTRQDVPVIDRTRCAPASGLQKGAYVLRESGGVPDALLIGTGSEVHLALDAATALENEGIRVRVVSMPSGELFDRQSGEYRAAVLPPSVTVRVAVEAGITRGWERYVGLEGATVGMEGFGASAPGPVLYEKFGITTDRVAAVVRDLVRRRGRNA
ncbi:MAG: transketolase [Deltaproteobacteria bacterium]|nr:transketolase [Deltaproteobacteria bacterium]